MIYTVRFSFSTTGPNNGKTLHKQRGLLCELSNCGTLYILMVLIPNTVRGIPSEVPKKMGVKMLIHKKRFMNMWHDQNPLNSNLITKNK